MLFEILFQFIFEIFGQLIFELLAEFGIRGVRHATNVEKPKNPALASFGYMILAAIAGGCSLFIFPSHIVKYPSLRIINLLLSPLVVGVFMSLRRKSLIKNGRAALRLDSFVYGFAFALVFGLVRFFFAH